MTSISAAAFPKRLLQAPSGWMRNYVANSMKDMFASSFPAAHHSKLGSSGGLLCVAQCPPQRYLLKCACTRIFPSRFPANQVQVGPLWGLTSWLAAEGQHFSGRLEVFAQDP